MVAQIPSIPVCLLFVLCDIVDVKERFVALAIIFHGEYIHDCERFIPGYPRMDRALDELPHLSFRSFDIKRKPNALYVLSRVFSIPIHGDFP